MKLVSVIEEARTKQGSVRLVGKLYEIKIGEAIKTVLLKNLHLEWEKIPRKKSWMSAMRRNANPRSNGLPNLTLALTAGVPLELVQKVTGHKTADIVLKHYFQPGREAFRHALQIAMPKLLTNGQKSPKEEMIDILNKMTAKTWKKSKIRLEKLLNGF